MTVTKLDLEMLDHVADGNVTYRGRSYRLWTSDRDTYQLVTHRVNRLVKAGLAHTRQGWRYGVGGVELTLEGKEVLG